MLPRVAVVVGIHYGLLVVVKDANSSFRANRKAMLVEVTTETSFIAQYNLPSFALILRTQEAAVATHGIKVTVGSCTENRAVAANRLPNILRPKDAKAAEAKDDD